MSRFAARSRRLTDLPVGLALLSLSLGHSPAQDASNSAINAQQSAYRSSIAQESVRKDADKIQSDLGQLVTELKLNGLGGANLATLSQASTRLSGLSQEEMQKVVEMLQNASIASDGSKRQQSLLGAYQGQQDVVLKLKHLAAGLAAQQAGDRLINQIESLIARQSSNIRETSVLKDGGHTTDQLDAREKSLHTVVISEQTAIGGQIDLLSSSLSAQITSSSSTPDPGSQIAKALLDAMNGTMLKATAPLATQLTNAGPFPEAVDKQGQVKQYLIAILRAAESKTDASTRLTQAKGQLEQVLADQKDLSDVTKQAKVDPAALAERQAEINDRAEVAKALLQSVSPDATRQVDTAQKEMQQSSNDLSDPQKQQDASAQQDAAIQALANADVDVDQQIAAVQSQQNEQPTQQMAQLQKAQDEIKAAQQEQQISPQDAAKDAQQAQQDAMANSPDAADKLADAASQLQQQSQQSPSSQQSSHSPQSQQSQASQDLAQASQDLQNQQNALAQSAQDYPALSQASQQLSQAQQQAQAADQSLQNGHGNDLSDPVRRLADAESTVSQVSQNSQSNLPSDAQQALQKAGDALKNSSIQAVQANRSGADAQDKQAIAALQQAQSAVSQAMSQIQSQSQQQQGKGPGQPSTAQGKPDQQATQGGTGTDTTMAQILPGFGPGSVQRGTALIVGGLSPKDRDAITQYQAEKTPPEYAPLVQQYLKNLADVSETH